MIFSKFFEFLLLKQVLHSTINLLWIKKCKKREKNFIKKNKKFLFQNPWVIRKMEKFSSNTN